MATTKKETVIVFKGDDKDYNKSLKRVGKNTKSTTERIQKMGKVATGILGAMGATVAGLIRAYSEQEEVETRLEATIQRLGDATDVTAEKINRLANRLQQTTRFGDEATLAASNLALRLVPDLDFSSLERFIEISADMAEVMGTDLVSESQKLARALVNPTSATRVLTQAGVTLSETQRRLLTDLINNNQAAEAQALILDLLSESSIRGSANLNTLSVRFARLKNNLGDIAQALGKFLAIRYDDHIKAVEDLVYWVKTLVENVEKANPVLKFTVRQFERFGKVLLFVVGAAGLATLIKLLKMMVGAAVGQRVITLLKAIAKVSKHVGGGIRGWAGAINFLRPILLRFTVLLSGPLGIIVAMTTLVGLLKKAYDGFKKMQVMKGMDWDSRFRHRSMQDFEKGTDDLPSWWSADYDKEDTDYAGTVGKSAEGFTEKFTAQQEAWLKGEQNKYEKAKTLKEEYETWVKQYDKLLAVAVKKGDKKRIKELESLYDVRTKQYEKDSDAAKKAEVEKWGNTIRTTTGSLATMFREHDKFQKELRRINAATALAELLYRVATDPAKAFGATVAKGGFWSLPKAFAVAAMTSAQLAAGLYAVKNAGMEKGGMIMGNPNLGDVYHRMLSARETVVPQKDFDTLKRGILAEAGNPYGDQDLNVKVELDLSEDLGKVIEVKDMEREGLGY